MVMNKDEEERVRAAARASASVAIAQLERDLPDPLDQAEALAISHDILLMIIKRALDQGVEDYRVSRVYSAALDHVKCGLLALQDLVGSQKN